MKTLEINLINKRYKIYIKRRILFEIGQYLKDNFCGKKVTIITDNNLNSLYGENLVKTIIDNGFSTKIISIIPGEESKTMTTLAQIYKELSDFKISRSDLIITFGGGVVGDLGGFAASTYLRGVPYIQIPTSLLAQVDSSIGGKVAIDLPEGKNLVGSFYHPDAVFIDPQLLKTLNKRFLHDGLAEVIKYGCIKDISIIEKLISYRNDLELINNIDEIIYTCCNIKKHLVESDEKDFGERMLLNFGHTLGHAIEKYFDFNKYTHGEAVGLGMIEITKKSENLFITEKGTLDILVNVLEKYDLPIDIPPMEKDILLGTIALDKKNSGDNISIILLKKLGEGFINKISVKEITSYI
jgi:3-dehydroquinate synthase